MPSKADRLFAVGLLLAAAACAQDPAQTGMVPAQQAGAFETTASAADLRLDAPIVPISEPVQVGGAALPSELRFCEERVGTRVPPDPMRALRERGCGQASLRPTTPEWDSITITITEGVHVGLVLTAERSKTGSIRNQRITHARPDPQVEVQRSRRAFEGRLVMGVLRIEQGRFSQGEKRYRLMPSNLDPQRGNLGEACTVEGLSRLEGSQVLVMSCEFNDHYLSAARIRPNETPYWTERLVIWRAHDIRTGVVRRLAASSHASVCIVQRGCPENASLLTVVRTTLEAS